MKKFHCCLFVICTAALIYAEEEYNFFMISDPHFGAAKTYCTDPAVPRRFRTKKNIYRVDKIMHLYKALFADMAKKSDAKTRFLVEAGDLIEGGTHNEETHKQVLTDALNLLKSYFKYPIYMVKGNHEAFGMGGANAYQTILIPEIAKYAGKQKLDFSNYSIKQGKDLFIFIDYYANAKGLQFLRNTLQEQKTKPRYVFLVLHLPLVPTASYAKEVFGICELLAQHNGIILAGHCHQNAVTHFEKDGKNLTQITVNSFIDVKPVQKMQLTPSLWTLERFHKYCLKRAKNNTAYIEALKNQWFPAIRDYKNFSGAGYARISVSDQGISVSFQSVDLSQKPVTIQLVTNKGK